MTRREREARAKLADTSEQIEKLAVEQRQVADQIRSTTVAILALRDSDVVRQGKDLDAERQLVKSLAAGLERAEAAHASRTGEDEELRDELEVAGERVTTARSNLETVKQDLRTLADRVGGQRIVGEARELLESTGSASVFTSMIGAWIDDRRTSISAVRAALVDHADAIRSRDAVATKVEVEVSDVEDAVDTERSAVRGCSRADQFASQLASWVTSASTLGVDTVRAAVPMPVEADDRSSASAGPWSAAGAECHVVSHHELVLGLGARRTRRDDHLPFGALAPGVLGDERRSRPRRPTVPRLVGRAAPTNRARRSRSCTRAIGLLDAWSSDGDRRIPSD